jgi:hypothetical protein
MPYMVPAIRSKTPEAIQRLRTFAERKKPRWIKGFGEWFNGRTADSDCAVQIFLDKIRNDIGTKPHD